MATRRLAALGLAVVGLLTLVSLAGRGPRPLGVGGGTEHVGPQFFDYAFTTVVIAFLAGLTLIAVASGGLRRGIAPTQRRAWWQNIVALVVIVLLFALVARVHEFPQFANPGGSGTAAHRARSLPRDPSTKTGRDVEFKWIEVAVAGGLALAALAALVVAWQVRRRRSAGPAAGSPGSAAETVSSLLDDALHDLRSERDLRRAVIAAYARMERALAAGGLPRRLSEAPLEYVERALLRLEASAGAVRRLTDLFEWAKFSHHHVDARMRDEAVDALARVRDELRAAAP